MKRGDNLTRHFFKRLKDVVVKKVGDWQFVSMSNLIQLQNGSKAYGGRYLFEDIRFSVNEGEHIGVIGPNGAGKTTLFKILIGEEELDVGQVVQSRQLRLGYLAQEVNWGPRETVEDYIVQGSSLPVWNLKKIGKGLGLSEEMFSSPVQSLSGGYRMRCKLLALIGQEPNVMLLDEPTNYLDLETLIILESFLIDFQGAFLLISHDREFLKRTTDHILEIEQGDVCKFSGHIDDYFEQKSQLRELIEKKALKVQAKRKQIQDFAAKFGAKATKAKQVQSRLKQMGKLQKVEVRPLSVKARINLPEPPHFGRILIKLNSTDLGYDQNVVLSNVSLEIQKGDHIGVVGFNGAGKSTLLKSLAQLLKPLKGDVKISEGMKVGYFAQHVSEYLLGEDTVLESLGTYAATDMTLQDLKDLAGALMFSGDDVKKKIVLLSGGEKARVALGQILAQKTPVLLLDEPTNHLDFYTVEALTQALQAYKGTVVVVSHDRSFIKRVAKKILEIRDGEVGLYPGNYDEYVWSVQKGAMGLLSSLSSEEAEMTAERESHPMDKKFNYKESKKIWEKRRRELEKELKMTNREMEHLNHQIKELNKRAMAGGHREILDDLSESQILLEKSEEKWMELEQELGKVRENLENLVK